MRFVRLAILCASLAGCDAPAPTVAAQAPPPDHGPPMQPLRPRPPAPRPPRPLTPPPPPPAFPDQVVVAGRASLGWHHFPTLRVIDGPWTLPGVAAEPGDHAIPLLGETLEGCRVTPVRGGEATWCPGVGVVAHTGRDGEREVSESVIAIRRGDRTRARSPCDVMHFLDDGSRRGLCDVPLRTLGAGATPSRPPAPPSCRWRYTPDGPSSGRRPVVVTVRLSQDIGELDAWTTDTPSAARTWIARREGWAAAVRIDGRACGAAEGQRFADRLVTLAPR